MGSVMRLYIEREDCPICGIVNALLASTPVWLLIIIALVLWS